MTTRTATTEQLALSLPTERDAGASRPSTQRAERWALFSVHGLGSASIQRLSALCGGDLTLLWRSPEQAARSSAKVVRAPSVARRLAARLKCPAEPLYREELERLEAGETLLHRHDPSYPRRLLDLPDPPEFVYVRGALTALAAGDALALVGSRRVPAAHLDAARRLAAELAEREVTVVSGGALGMDAAAHRGALDVGGLTCAVLPGGLRRLAPRRNVALFEQIVERGGALLSEYPLTCSPRRYHYARRNRLIASLARSVLVLKAAAQGGTLLTVEAACELGRSVLALPYEADDLGARGSHALIASRRATMVCDVEQILAHGLGRLALGAASVEEGAPKRGARGGVVVAAAQTFENGERVSDVDALARLWNMSPEQAMVRLFELEISGRVRKVPGSARYEILGAL